MKTFKETRDFKSILGQDQIKKQLRSALIMDRNIMLVGPPGIGKTTLAKNVAEYGRLKYVERKSAHRYFVHKAGISSLGQ